MIQGVQSGRNAGYLDDSANSDRPAQMLIVNHIQMSFEFEKPHDERAWWTVDKDFSRLATSYYHRAMSWTAVVVRRRGTVAACAGVTFQMR